MVASWCCGDERFGIFFAIESIGTAYRSRVGVKGLLLYTSRCFNSCSHSHAALQILGEPPQERKGVAKNWVSLLEHVLPSILRVGKHSQVCGSALKVKTSNPISGCSDADPTSCIPDFSSLFVHGGCLTCLYDSYGEVPF